MSHLLADIIGLTGVICIVVSYLLIQIGYLQTQSIRYSLYNGIGAFFVLISLLYNFNLSAFIVELFWLLISLFGIIRYFQKTIGLKSSKEV